MAIPTPTHVFPMTPKVGREASTGPERPRAAVAGSHPPEDAALALVHANLVAHRRELLEHNAVALLGGARVLATMRELLHGHVSAVRCDRSARRRQDQLDGVMGLPVEDFLAIGAESPEGERAAVAGVRELAAAFGYALTPFDSAPAELGDGHARLAECTGALLATFARSIADGRVDKAEARELLRSVRALIENASALEAALVELVERG